MTDVLLVHVEKALGADKSAKLQEQLRAVCKGTGLRPVLFDQGIGGEVHRDLDGLVSAIEAQTQAINALAESNRAVVDYLLAQEAEEHDEAPDLRYLDGSPKD
ncbi:hypothetical protein MKP05_09480 [Halomonas sp. EGI 63088]|uniref:Uncharacterized protein n=1 Tax=Halomonas flagellata TaxID=2920385 RepID=A0ABS9RU30_9GAMM|nr:hypothetical protein [Halomonas flagellata]MCH4563360.1 hypothetical protein [Halomonas flagellata]